MTTEAGGAALRHRFAPRTTGPAREHPALCAESAVRGLDAPLDSFRAHLIEHHAKRVRRVAAQAIVRRLTRCRGARSPIAEVHEVSGRVRRRERSGRGTVDEREPVVAVDEGDLRVGRGEERAQGSAALDEGAGVTGDRGRRAEWRRGGRGRGPGRGWVKSRSRSRSRSGRGRGRGRVEVEVGVGVEVASGPPPESGGVE